MHQKFGHTYPVSISCVRQAQINASKQTSEEQAHREVEQLKLMSLRRNNGSCVGACSKQHMRAASISPELHGPQGGDDLLPLTLPVLVAPDDTMCVL